MSLTGLLLTVALLVLILTAYLILLSRHKKSATGAINLMGSTGIVQSALNPEGAVIVDGELWRARSVNAGSIGANERVRIVGVKGLLVLVEPLSDKV
jgi:membrane-bound serine protease (ClpP class)